MQKTNKKIIILIIIAICIFIVIYYNFFYKEKNIEITNINNFEISNAESRTNENKIEDTGETIKVYITGKVKNPGVYKIKAESRIADVIEAAGGITEDANIEKINLAYILEDGMKIEIPSNKESLNKVEDETTNLITKNTNGVTNSDTNNEKAENKKITNKVNINTATQTELETLPGIGPSIALRICKYREENGKFKSIEEIKNISGIGSNKYQKIKNLIKT